MKFRSLSPCHAADQDEVFFVRTVMNHVMGCHECQGHRTPQVAALSQKRSQFGLDLVGFFSGRFVRERFVHHDLSGPSACPAIPLGAG